MRTPLGVLALVLVLLATSVPASADTSGPDPGEPVTVSADPLPTVQINGVVWSQAIVGDTVYAGGRFTSARPAGAAPGTNTVTRSNLLAYDITTGALITSFAPNLNGQVLSVAASPDGTRVYIGGQFTSVDGRARSRVAAFDTATGALLDFAPSAGTTVRAVAATDDTVYLGGDFQTVNGAGRPNIAAVTTGGQLLTGWNPAANAQVTALTLNPSGAMLIVGGRFTTLGGQPSYGMGALAADTGQARPWAIESVVRTAGVNSSVTSLAADASSVYGTSYTYGTGGNFEGTWRADGETGQLQWISDCHGDHYSTWPAGDVVYSASHAHYCGNISDGFSDTNPRSYYHSTAVTNAARAPNDYNPLYALASFDGLPSPALLHWYPIWSVGSFTGQTQAGWHVTGNDDYIVFGGEFPAVNGLQQQGLVRFARPALATNAAAPQATASLTPAAVSVEPGTVDVGWQATFDRDNRNLTYRLYRGTALIDTRTVASTPWRRPSITFRDEAPGGGQQPYRVTATDPFGNAVGSATTTVAVASSENAYGRAVIGSEPEHWFRMNETSGSALRDSRGSAAATGTAALVRGGLGAVAGDSATTFPGTSSGYASTEVSQQAPQVVSVEAWIRTGTTAGGRIIGFGDRRDATSKSGWTDRHLYMDNAGRLFFGVDNGSKRTVGTPPGYNDNAWHHVVGTLGPGGLRLYVDGVLRASNAAVVSARKMQGVWRIGGDILAGWGSRPSSDFFAGSIDEAAVYHRELTASQVLGHFEAAGGGQPGGNVAPLASFTVVQDGLQVSVDGSGSSDSDGSITQHSWSFGDGSAVQTGSAASHTYAASGTYQVTLIVTDDEGATGQAARSVTVPGGPPPVGVVAADGFSRTVAGGWGSADSGGAWTVSGSVANYSVDGSAGTARAATAGSSASAYLAGAVALDQDISAVLSADPIASGGGSYINIAARGGASNAYRAKVVLSSSGTVSLQAVRLVGGAQTTLQSAAVPGLTLAPGGSLRVRVQVAGAFPTTLRAKVWAASAAEPAAWQVAVTDSTAPLQAPAGLGFMWYVSGSAANAPILFRLDDLEVR